MSDVVSKLHAEFDLPEDYHSNGQAQSAPISPELRRRAHIELADAGLISVTRTRDELINDVLTRMFNRINAGLADRDKRIRARTIERMRAEKLLKL